MLLIDRQYTARLDMNSTVTQVLTKLIALGGIGLKAQVATSTMPIGRLLSQDYVAMSNNYRIFDLMAMIADTIGWRIRVQDTTVIVGPPPTRGQVPEIAKEWGHDAGVKLKVTHSALHSRNIKVIVRSYLPRLKSAITGTGAAIATQPGTLGAPSQQPSSAPTQPAPSGRQVGLTSVGEDYGGEIYVFNEKPGMTQAQCDIRAAAIRDDLTRHEFIAELQFAPSVDELRTLVAAGTEFTVALSGCSQPSHNGLYHPKKVTFTYDLGETDSNSATGLTVNILMVNHELPTPSGGSV